MLLVRSNHSPCLAAQPLALVGVAPRWYADHPQRRCRLCLDAVAAEVASEREAAAELRLRPSANSPRFIRIAASRRWPSADERRVVDLLGGRDAGRAGCRSRGRARRRSRPTSAAKHERHLAPENGVIGVLRKALRLASPGRRCASAARPCRWSMSPSRSNASHSTSVRSPKRDAASATST